MKKIIVGILAAAVIVVAIVYLSAREDASSADETVLRLSPGAGARVTARPAGEPATVGGVVPNAPQAEDDETSSEETSEEESQTEEERREAEEEKRVDAFDDLTDKWQEPSKSGVAMADIDNFVKSFRMIPKARQDECIHRALNLIPDENVMLLAGVLMDKEMDKEIVETVYNDILNRDEDVKKPVLQQIFKDKTHPCWADTAWILDVTDELPKK